MKYKRNFDALVATAHERDDLTVYKPIFSFRGDHIAIGMKELVLLVYNNDWDDNEDDTMTCVYMYKDVYERLIEDMKREKQNNTSAGDLPPAIFAMSYGYGYRWDDNCAPLDEKDVLAFFNKSKNNPARRIGKPLKKINYLVQTGDGRTTVAVFDSWFKANHMLCELYHGMECGIGKWPAGACDDMRIIPIAINQLDGFID